jgi:hypothetical protein
MQLQDVVYTLSTSRKSYTILLNSSISTEDAVDAEMVVIGKCRSVSVPSLLWFP